MRIHLFTTDRSALELCKLLDPSDRIVAVVIPENRKAAPKVEDLVTHTTLPVAVQPRGGGIPADLPAADAGISWLYSQLILEKDIARYEHGILNMHGGKLPDYRGANVLQWAIVNGERELGVTWHQIGSETDAGPVWGETAIPIPADADAAAMRPAMIDAGLRIFPAAWQRFTSGSAPLRVVSPASGKVWPQRRPRDGKIGKAWPERRVRNLIRALPPPWPRATVDVDGSEHDVVGIGTEGSACTVPYKTEEGEVLFLKIERRDA